MASLAWICTLALYSILVLPLAQLLSNLVANAGAVWLSSVLLLLLSVAILRRFVITWPIFATLFTVVPMAYLFGYGLRAVAPTLVWQDRLISSLANPATRGALFAIVLAPLIVGFASWFVQKNLWKPDVEGAA